MKARSYNAITLCREFVAPLLGTDGSLFVSDTARVGGTAASSAR